MVFGSRPVAAERRQRGGAAVDEHMPAGRPDERAMFAAGRRCRTRLRCRGTGARRRPSSSPPRCILTPGRPTSPAARPPDARRPPRLRGPRSIRPSRGRLSVTFSLRARFTTTPATHPPRRPMEAVRVRRSTTPSVVQHVQAGPLLRDALEAARHESRVPVVPLLARIERVRRRLTPVLNGTPSAAAASAAARTTSWMRHGRVPIGA